MLFPVISLKNFAKIGIKQALRRLAVVYNPILRLNCGIETFCESNEKIYATPKSMRAPKSKVVKSNPLTLLKIPTVLLSIVENYIHKRICS